ncbi:hypothetical protein PVAND_013803 [Polypedilum vanderplanki]|uniref:LisH domain-containing protein n=1 Tax=Polypedilum vanderplanki TaxID=319348 RepID=A0A9J6CQH4_POLVA|nr:hypothetical protein PVAND_013803 [Polypedilum vanderplanki]
MNNGSGDMADLKDILYRVMKEKLLSSNVLNDMAAKLRHEIHNVILNRVGNDMTVSINGTKGPTGLLNKLIQEYLDWMCYRYTSEMFNTETVSESTSRENLEAQFHKPENFDEEIPILLDIVMKYMRNEKEEMASSSEESLNRANENSKDCIQNHTDDDENDDFDQDFTNISMENITNGFHYSSSDSLDE